MEKKKIKLDVSSFRSFLNYFKPILSDFNKEVIAVYTKNKYDIHNIVGLGIGLLIFAFCILVAVPSIFLKIILPISGAWVAGFLNEGYQQTVHKAETDNRDMRMTGYGGVVSVPLGFLLLYLGFPLWSLGIIGILLIVLGFLLNKKRK